jgi:hypothetical protein
MLDEMPFSEAVEREIAALSDVSIATIGEAPSPKRTYPIFAVTTPASPDGSAPWMLVSGGVHGDEIAGAFAAVAFLRDVAPRFARRVNFAVLPCINPTGFEARTLATVRGANLNRLFGTESREPEIEAVERWLQTTNRQYRMTFDFHEISAYWRGEGFVERDNPHDAYLYETQRVHSARIGRRMIDALPPATSVCQWPTIYEDIAEGGLISYPDGCRNATYAAGTSFDAYLNGRFTQHSFTTETPIGWSLEKRVETHLIWIRTAIEALEKTET